MGEMKWPRLYMLFMLMGAIVFSTWSGIAYARGDSVMHIGFAIIAAMFSGFAYLRGIRSTIKD